MLCLSFFAARKIPVGKRVPMQWGLDGKPTWFGPRLVGLLLMPMIASLLVLLLAVADSQGASQHVHPAPDGLKAIFAFGWLGVHAAYLRAICKSAA